MPAAMTADCTVIFTRRGDPDPPVGVGEVYNATGVYLYTFVRIGTVRVKFEGDKPRAARMLTHLFDELKEKLAGIEKGAPASADIFSEDDAGAIVRSPTAMHKQEQRGGARKRVKTT